MLLCNALLGSWEKKMVGKVLWWALSTFCGFSTIHMLYLLIYMNSNIEAVFIWVFQLICIYYTQNVIHFSPIFTSLILVIYSFTQHITIETFTPCLVDLCKALWGVLKSYYKTMKWHETNDKDTATQSPEPGIWYAFPFNLLLLWFCCNMMTHSVHLPKKFLFLLIHLNVY